MTLRLLSSLSLIAITMSLVSKPLFADDAPPPPKKPWTATMEASLLSANGNTKTTTTGVKGNVIRSWEKTTLDLNARGMGSQDRSRVTAEQYSAGEKTSYDLSQRTYIQERYQWDKDRFAGIRSRHEATAGGGYRLLTLPSHDWVFELGAGRVWEDRTKEEAKNFTSGRAFSKYAYKISPTASFIQTVEYLHDFDDSDDYRLNTDSALVASISSHLALKTSFTWRRVGKPPVGFVRDDTTTSVALVVNY